MPLPSSCTNHAQTAIVGVFLRKLEYFRGILFLATNQTKADEHFDIDEAILSRCVAVIDFAMPTREEAKEIWRVQAAQLGAKLEDSTIDALAEHFNLSGRSIRNLLRLSKAMSTYRNGGDEDVPITARLVKHCYKSSAKLRFEGVRNAS